MNMKKSAAMLLSSLLLAGCASSEPAASTSAPHADSFDADRRAILKLAGAYDVNFTFRETVVLQDGYKPHEFEETGADELVVVVSDEPKRIELQHLLLTGDAVVKHWREVWTYEPSKVLEFAGERTWKTRELSSQERQGKWAQEVFEVSDEPRYTGIGAWCHEGGSSHWESNESWRPLPRREYTTRSDYNLLLSRHRVQFTPKGWVHEQDSVKVQLGKGDEPSKALVREQGLNSYNRVDAKTLAACEKYWQRTGPFWADVRAAWDEVYAKHPKTLQLESKVDGKPMFAYLFEVAKSTDAKPAERKQKVRDIIAKFVKPESSSIATR